MGNALSQEATIRKCRIVRTPEVVLQCVRLDAWSVVAVLWVATLATKAENGVRILYKPVHRNSTDRPVGDGQTVFESVSLIELVKRIRRCGSS